MFFNINSYYNLFSIKNKFFLNKNKFNIEENLSYFLFLNNKSCLYDTIKDLNKHVNASFILKKKTIDFKVVIKKSLNLKIKMINYLNKKKKYLL